MEIYEACTSPFQTEQEKILAGYSMPMERGTMLILGLKIPQKDILEWIIYCPKPPVFVSGRLSRKKLLFLRAKRIFPNTLQCATVGRNQRAIFIVGKLTKYFSIFGIFCHKVQHAFGLHHLWMKEINIVLTAKKKKRGGGEKTSGNLGSNFFSIFSWGKWNIRGIITRIKIQNYFRNSKVKAGWRWGFLETVIKRNVSLPEHKQLLRCMEVSQNKPQDIPWNSCGLSQCAEAITSKLAGEQIKSIVPNSASLLDPSSIYCGMPNIRKQCQILLILKADTR